MHIWRLHISPDSKPNVDPRAFCFEKSILGVGWGVDADAPLDWPSYYELANKQYYEENKDKEWWPVFNAIYNRMAIDDLCWTRDWDGTYYLGRVTGEWQYCSTQEYVDADIRNIRSCNWVLAGGADSVPGKVLNSFRPSRTLQAVHGGTVGFYSRLRFNQLSGHAAYSLSGKEYVDLLSLIAPEDCEDILAIYLQKEFGYCLIPSSCRHDTVGTEFVMRKGKGKAHVQVKQGHVSLNLDDFKLDARDPCNWFLFTTEGQYLGKSRDHIRCINPNDIRLFAFSHRELMSSRVQAFIDYCVSL